MVSFRRRSSGNHSPTTTETDADKLLAPKRRGLFGGRKNNDGDRSDTEAPPPKSGRAISPFKRRKDTADPPTEPRKVVVMSRKHASTNKGNDKSSSRALSPFKRRMQKDRKEDPAATPPVTPENKPNDTDEDDTPLQVKVVTVKAQSSAGTKNNSPSGDNHNNGEDDSVMSDLTDNRTYKRLADYKETMAKERDAAAAAAAASELSPVQEDEKIASVKARLEKVKAAQAGSDVSQSDSAQQYKAGPSCRDGDDNLNPVAFLLKYMDHACTSEQQPAVSKTYSFVPEWGMAPSRDERDKSTLAAAATKDEDDDEMADPQSSAPTSSTRRAVRDEIHENFEMVLEDLQSTEGHLGNKRQQRNWMGAINFRRNADKKDQTTEDDDQEREAPPSRSQDDEAEAVPSSIKSKGGGLHNKAISPLTVEEEKKEEDFFEEQAKESNGARKMGNKILKSFRRLKKNRSDLAPVSEDDELGTGPSEATELKVRVPDNKTSLTEKDLIGDNVVQDIYRDLETSMESAHLASVPEEVQATQDMSGLAKVVASKQRPSSPQSQSLMDSTLPSKEPTRTSDDDEDYSTADGETTNMLTSFMSLLSGGKDLPAEVRDIPDKGDIPKSKSWVDQFRMTMSEDTYDAYSPSKKDQPALDRQRSAPHNTPNHAPRKPKVLWREATDPKTGRPYYYHRITREVTWKKPQEMIDFETQHGIETSRSNEDDRRLLSVLSDGDLAAAAERTAQMKSEAAMRKKDARDFDPHVWAVKEQIAKLLQTMSPPDGSSIDQILKQYEGREEALLQQLREMKEARPFDEPVAANNTKSSEASRSKSVPRLRQTSLLTRSNSKKDMTSLNKNEEKANEISTRTQSKRPEPVKVETNAKSTQSSATATDDPQPAEPEGRAPERTAAAEKAERKVSSDSPPRNVARAVRARLAARRAANAQAAAKKQAEESEDNMEEPPKIVKSTNPVSTNKENTPVINKTETQRMVSTPPKYKSEYHKPEAFNSRVRTSGSGVTKVSEKTEVIRNTAKKRNTLNTVGEVRTVGSDATSLSSTGLEPRINVTMSSTPGPIPGKISAPRTRELMVEEFSQTDRSYRSEVYDKKRTVRAGRFGTTGTRRKPFTTPSLYPHDGDDSTRTDSVSALSMDDTKPLYDTPYGVAKGGTDDARRRALDDAIAREDWDLAAALSDAMRTLKARPVMPPPQVSEWKQSELDRFISQNDWDAVANYIASVRSKTQQSNDTLALPMRPGFVSQAAPVAKTSISPSSITRPSSRLRPPELPSPDLFDEGDELMNNPKKRFGAKSQLQHTEIQSESSWDSEDESSYSSDDYSSASSFSEPRRRGKNRYRYASKHSLPMKSRKGRPKEFAC